MMNTRVEMNEEMMMNVNGGGLAAPLRPGVAYKDIVHKDCGGHISRPVFDYCVCDKCGESHFWFSEFAIKYIW